MAIILFDNQYRSKLFPLTLTKAVADLRLGILTIKERWQKQSNYNVFVQTDDYLQPLYESIPNTAHFWIDASVIYTHDLWTSINALEDNEGLYDDIGLIAARLVGNVFDPNEFKETLSKVSQLTEVQRLQYPQQFIQWNDQFIRDDFKLITAKRASHLLALNNNFSSVENIFIEEGASIHHSTINASTGPIYIGKHATIMEGCLIRGPFSLGENAVLKMGSKVYGATTVGPNCMGGGEIKNSIMMGCSNKAHDGYLGDSIIGEWCNLGAGTSNSNVKNTGGTVKLYNYYTNSFEAAGDKCGMVMGDYSRAAINSSFNTGSVIGICCNVFGSGLLPKRIQDFTWGIGDKYAIDKAIADINNWKMMKGKEISDEEVKVLKHIFEKTNSNEKV